MNTQHQLLIARCVYPMVLLFGVGLAVFAHFIPPPRPTASAQEIAATYLADANMIRMGMVLLMMAAVLFIPFFAAIGFQMARIEGARPILAVTQMLIGVATAMLVLLPAISFAVAAFRPDRDPQLILVLNDLGWMTLLWPFAPAFFQELLIAYCVLTDKSQNPLFPRWVGYLNAWVALLFLPGALIPFFQTGPFAWNGVLGLWIPLTAFFVWIVVMAVVLMPAIKRADPLS